MDSQHFLTLAKQLVKKNFHRQKEANYRTVISRAYYACFLKTREIVYKNAKQELIRADVYNIMGIRHKKLSMWLINSNEVNISLIGKDLDSFRINRENADYEMSQTHTKKDAENMIKEAKKYIEELNNISLNELKNLCFL